jgi:hypothetical protein
MKYNGWTNKETWLVNLWHGESLAEMKEAGEDITAYYAQRMVTDWVDDTHHSLDGFVWDMLKSALASVNWEEVASHYKND